MKHLPACHYATLIPRTDEHSAPPFPETPSVVLEAGIYARARDTDCPPWRRQETESKSEGDESEVGLKSREFCFCIKPTLFTVCPLFMS